MSSVLFLHEHLISNINFGSYKGIPKDDIILGMSNQKQCRYCYKYYPENTFGVALTTVSKVYRRRKCRYCYQKTKRILIQRHYEWINSYKQERGCTRCGVTNPVVLDFHHKNETNKRFGIGGFRREVGFQKIQEEIEKCEVICANCHRIVHHEAKKNGA